jgi:hypothetical protein
MALAEGSEGTRRQGTTGHGSEPVRGRGRYQGPRRKKSPELGPKPQHRNIQQIR